MQTLPYLSLYLAPAFDAQGAAVCIDVRMVFCAPNLAEKREEQEVPALFRHTLKRGPIKTQQYSSDSIWLASASQPMIPLTSKDNEQGTLRTFSCDVDIDLPGEELIAHYRAVAADVDETSPCGPQIALERDGGGLSGCGMAIFLTLSSDVCHDIRIIWDLSLAPASTRAVCTFGEGDQRVRGQPSILEEAFFMVGPVSSSPGPELHGPYGAYWLSEPPFDATDLARKIEAVVPKMRLTFGDYDSPLFRVFIRHNVYKCVSGRGLYQGFVFAWNDIQHRNQENIIEFVFHEIVHNWPRLGFSAGGPTPAELADGWFNEGIAEYYSLVLPFRFGIFSKTEFVQRFNRRISGYYTNPDRGVPNSEVPGKFWLPGHYDRIPYQRGFMYFVQLSDKLRKSGKRPLDALIVDMVALRRAKLPHHMSIWLDMVEKEIGTEARDDYERMCSAELIRLPHDCMETFVPCGKWLLRREDQEEFCLGFSESSLTRTRAAVTDLDPKSRASVAGVQESDTITKHFSYMFDAEIWDQTFSMVVCRDGEERRFTWWPRSWDKVESYQFHKE